MASYYDWKTSTVTCDRCGWHGLGSDAELGDIHREGAEYHRPRFDAYFGLVAYPLISEVKADPRADALDRLAIEVVEQRAASEANR